MPTVTFIPSGKRESVAAGVTIIEAAKQAGLAVETPCNCMGTCRKCRVQVEGRVVLACQTRVDADLSVHIPKSSDTLSLKIVTDGVGEHARLDPAIAKEYDATTDTTEIRFDGTTAGVEAGNTTDTAFGVVVDIGTTTLVASLVDLASGCEIGSTSSVNPQAIHAQDVLSRIRFAQTLDGLETLYREITGQVDEMIGDLALRNGVDVRRIYEIVFSGNTCMLHLAIRIDPTSLGKYPYGPRIRGGGYELASEHLINTAPFARIYLPPIISSYVGADITSGILASELLERPGRVLFVDIGTNGEVVLNNNGVLSATSTAAGPAFEGMNISCGMRAERGAIEEFSIGEDGLATWKTIGNAPPTGLCGSGLFDVVAELVNHGVLTPSGRFADPSSARLRGRCAENLTQHKGKPAYLIKEDLHLTQEDVRQVQLAKGAIRAGIEMLLTDSGIAPVDLDQILIAGSFGYHLKEESILNVGLLPHACKHKVSFAGNTSKSGGAMLLLDKSSRSRAMSIVSKVRVMELANLDGFDRVFAKSLGF